MLHSLYLMACLTVASIFYGATPAPSSLITALIVGFLFMPILAFLIAVTPNQATLVRGPGRRDWYPAGLATAHALVVIALGFCISRDLDTNADVTKHLAADFDIHLASEVGLSLAWTAGMSVTLVLALEAGKNASYLLIPLYEWCGLMKFDYGPMEQMEDAERQLDEWTTRHERERYW